ncbi:MULTISPECIES: SDR family oxidoreductase [Pseudomonas]|uniref:SDR family oxidoreductase n=1 Tax=Pseudomonas lijiangensis TaxID=2995658 RepID=A0ABX8HZN5_9PSED|nr:MULTISPECIES: SDR family oxidoreductase [Pseudomonas]MBI6852781.1 SDR family oxidoreductase [Pseudomonas cichorii]MBX8477812.1 SDR family oxidoreductase [Pseudomonas cichorii]MBX8486589.1 SDR family oxidoreductase [Pseudomonas cichorii]MBX8497920.1 SDR family oxidoreductase [Pseudomonas cichorii]MBX8501619.1 SDR family oxidoreductase [Pseudomonas lijiangensis]
MAIPLSLPPVPEPVRGERLKGKVVLVTGAAQGIGEAIVACFQAQQARLIISDVQGEKVEQVAAKWRGQGAEVHALKVDVTQQDQWRSMVDLAIEHFGRVDVLINCAGVNVFRDPLEMSDEDWKRCFAIDLDGAWYGCRSVLPKMLEQGAGNIINIASTHSSNIIPGCFPYPVAKHGLLGLTRALGIEYAPKGIRVNAIAPGYIETQLNVDYWNGFDDPQAERQRAFDLHPPKRIGQPIEVAMTALFLATDEAPFINASCIMIDGGRSVLYHE